MNFIDEFQTSSFLNMPWKKGFCSCPLYTQVDGSTCAVEEERVQRAQLRDRRQDQAARARHEPTKRIRVRDILRRNPPGSYEVS